jgi:DNA repair protein RecN (Recombination protein N)
MLTQLNVRDFAIVETVDLAFDRGLTVVSGETGAGKSLLVDALLLLSGGRADSGVVRGGCERAELSAAFDLSDLPHVREWLREHELDDDGECLLRRVIRSEGASKAWINGRPVPAQTLAQLAAQLVEIHGQHEHQALLDRASQLALLDAHAGHASLLAEVAAQADRWRALERQRRELAGRTGDDGERLALLRHQLQELSTAALSPDAFHALEAEHHRLAHRGDSIEACAAVRDRLDGDDELSLLPALGRMRNQMDRALAADPSLAEIAALLSSAEVELREASASLDAYLDGVELDPARFQQVEAQLSRLHELARKHRVPAAELAAQRERLADEVARAESAGEDLAVLARDIESAHSAWRDAAARLSRSRAVAASELAAAVTSIMAELGMAGGRLAIELEPVSGAEPDRSGAERVEFTVSANPGQPLRPLRKVASGGELSRIALAIEVAALGKDPVPTMIFDEVDTGIGGAVAEVLGQKLRQLGTEVQVLCVTHLPQVAAQGHRHVRVAKHSDGGHTRTRVTPLDARERVDEIARMLGGIEITEATLAHARQMLERAERT